MMRKACSVAYQLASRPHARHLININMKRPEVGQLSSTGFRGPLACPTSGGIRRSTPACNFSMTVNHGSALDDVDDIMMESEAAWRP
ncbi:g529 [Coccomyxa viridis]|uniref:G529 protein n=1 Tax=Coccomyxa viridis TaxID=1274662 RepID=A0ABP1FHY3_9CHLO